MDLIMPTEYITTLAPLLNKCPVSDYNKLLFVVEQNFSECYKIIKSIDTNPLASGSLAQVHCAQLTTDSSAQYGFDKVVVKVRHPFITNMSNGDVMLIKLGTYVVELLINDFRIEWLGRTFHK